MPKLATVLLVDDDPTTNFLHQRLLHSMGVAEHLLVAENGQEALQTLIMTCEDPEAEACPVLVLLDVNMPVMSGVEFLEAYQQLSLPPPQRPVIIVLTTSANDRELARIRTLPVAAMLSKPLTREKVSALLEEHFPNQLTG